jgi:hypothetical protein
VLHSKFHIASLKGEVLWLLFIDYPSYPQASRGSDGGSTHGFIRRLLQPSIEERGESYHKLLEASNLKMLNESF